MGSLSYAVGLGMAGLGGAMADVGKESMKDQLQRDRDATILRLQAAEADKRQQAGFTEEEKLQKSGQTFTQQQTEAGYTHAGQAAGAAQAAKMKEIEYQEAHRDIRANTLAKSRVAARLAGAKQPPEYSYRTLSEKPTYGKNADGTPNYNNPIPGRQYVQMIHNPSGLQLVQVGGGIDPKTGTPNGGILLEHNANDTELPDPAKVGRAKVSAVNNLMAHPETGMEFFRAYHYLPSDWLTKYQERQGAQTSPGLPKFVTPGTTAGPMTGLGGGGAAEDTEDQQAVDGGGDYGNYGDAGRQASDDTTAQ